MQSKKFSLDTQVVCVCVSALFAADKDPFSAILLLVSFN